jgi:DNA-binding NtrC family response regulator
MLEEQISKPFAEIIGKSQAIQEVFNLTDKVAKTEANVLILGENGTGKELIARAIHQRSLRKDNSFVSVDMGAITETLFESELFGHKKGSLLMRARTALEDLNLQTEVRCFSMKLEI